MRANWLCGRFCVQASSFENYISEKPFTDRFVQQSRYKYEIKQKNTNSLYIRESSLTPFDQPENRITIK